MYSYINILGFVICLHFDIWAYSKIILIQKKKENKTNTGWTWSNSYNPAWAHWCLRGPQNVALRSAVWNQKAFFTTYELWDVKITILCLSLAICKTGKMPLFSQASTVPEKRWPCQWWVQDSMVEALSPGWR